MEIHGVLSDACMLDTCCVTNERWKVTCFVTNADNLTMLCREEDVEANVCLHLHAKFKSCLIIFDVFAQHLPSALSKVATHPLLCCERLLSTRVSIVARIWHVPVSRWCSGWWGVVVGPSFDVWNWVIFLICAIFLFCATVEWFQSCVTISAQAWI